MYLPDILCAGGRRFLVNYRLIGNEIKILHIHNSYEYMLPNEEKLLTMDGSTMQSIRSLLLEHPPGQRIAIRSGTQTAFVDLHTVLYVQSLGRKTEFVCIDKIISCNSSISEIAKELNKILYLIFDYPYKHYTFKYFEV